MKSCIEKIFGAVKIFFVPGQYKDVNGELKQQIRNILNDRTAKVLIVGVRSQPVLYGSYCYAL